MNGPINQKLWLEGNYMLNCSALPPFLPKLLYKREFGQQFSKFFIYFNVKECNKLAFFLDMFVNVTYRVC